MTTTAKSSLVGLKIMRKQLQRIRRKVNLALKQPAQVFDEIYQKNSWGDSESISGPGSRLDRTNKIRAALPPLLKKYECHSLLDIPCGDFNWMKTLELNNLNVDYIGADIVSELMKHNQERFSNPNRKFVRLDLLHDLLPEVDLVLCRDCLVHFSNANVLTALKNIKASRSKYLLTTTFPQRTQNANIVTGEWRPINLSRHPIDLPVPLEFIEDSYDSPNYYDKHLGLWKISDLPG